LFFMSCAFLWLVTCVCVSLAYAVPTRDTRPYELHIDEIGRLILTSNKFLVLLAMSNALTPQNLLLIF
jgi:hypothetical protein